MALGAVLVSSAAAGGTSGASFRMRLVPEHPALRVVYVGGSPGRLAGTGTLTSPGLPCPTVRHFH